MRYQDVLTETSVNMILYMRPGETMSKIARRIDTNLSHCSKLLKLLEEKDIVYKVMMNKREKKIFLTEKGIELKDLILRLKELVE